MNEFQYVNLSVNFSDHTSKLKNGGQIGEGWCEGFSECNDGGSYVCYDPSDCPPGSCIGISYKEPGVKESLNAKILIHQKELSRLKEELQSLIENFAKK